MLINCPRCGFQQPKDKYCAQCGVDMETYVPATPPAWKRFFGSPLVQLTFLIIIAAGVGGTLYKKGQQNLERRAGPLRSSVQISSSSDFSQTDNESEEGSTATNFLDTNTDTQTEPTASESADGVVTAYKVTNPAPAGHPSIVIYYTEMSRDHLATLFTASRNTGQFMEFNDYSAGLTPNVSKILTGPQVKILHKEVKSLENSKSLQWTYGIKDQRDPNSDIGLTTFLGINEIEGNTLRGNIEIQRSWREPLNSGSFEIQKRSFPAEFEVDAESGFFISGIMPRRSYLDNDQELSNIEVYKILASPQFRSGESNFVIFIDFDKGN